MVRLEFAGVYRTDKAAWEYVGATQRNFKAWKKDIVKLQVLHVEVIGVFEAQQACTASARLGPRCPFACVSLCRCA